MKSVLLLTLLGLILFAAHPTRADFPVAQTPFHDVFPAVAYNSTDDEYLVVWSSLVPVGGVVLPWAGFVVGQRIDAGGSLIGGPFIIIGNWCVINASVAYNSTDNEYMVVAAYGNPPELYGQRVGNTGTLIGTAQVLLSNVQKPKILYNVLADNYLVLGNGSGVYSRVISTTGQPLSGAVLLTDASSYPDYSVAYAPIVSPGTPHGRYLLEAGGLTLLDSDGNPMLTMYDPDEKQYYTGVPLARRSSCYTVSLAYGSPAGSDAFAAVWSGAGTYASTAWPGIWTENVNADQLLYYTSTSYPENDYPVSYIQQDAFYATDVPTWMPAAAYNPTTGTFFAVWRETPVPAPFNQLNVNHIRGDWLGRCGLKPTNPNFVLSATNGNENPRYPAVASSTKNGNVLVVWADMRDSAANGTDIYGTLFDIDQALPIQLASFKANPTAASSVLLQWNTVSEENNYGFEVQRRRDGDTSFKTLPGAFVPGHGTTAAPQNYAYEDHTITAGRWWYRLRQLDLDKSVQYSEPVSAVFTGNGTGAPTEIALHQNFPNPFNPTTTITYDLPKSAHVTLVVYDMLGREVATLVNGGEEAGFKSVVLDSGSLASGVYFYRLQVQPAGGGKTFIAVKKLSILK